MTQPKRPGSSAARQPLASASLNAVPSISPSPGGEGSGGGGSGGGGGGGGAGAGGGAGGGGGGGGVGCQAVSAIETGARLALDALEAGADLLGTGEMGIGNTTAASAITAAITGAPPERITGRGTGVDDAGLARKVEVVARALSVNAPDPRDGLDVLAKVGGFEIAGLVGVILAGASRRVPVVLDGFIAGAAALVAVTLAPRSEERRVGKECGYRSSAP